MKSSKQQAHNSRQPEQQSAPINPAFLQSLQSAADRTIRLNTKQVAEIIKSTPRYVRLLVAEGRLERDEEGLFSISQVVQFIKTRRKAGRPKRACPFCSNGDEIRLQDIGGGLYMVVACESCLKRMI